jgi:hypothetical protein
MHRQGEIKKFLNVEWKWMGEIYISLLAMQISIAHLLYSQRDKKKPCQLENWFQRNQSEYLFTKLLYKNND